MKKTPLILLTSIMLSAYSYVAYGDIEYGSEQHGLRENDGREAFIYYTITPQVISEAYKNSKFNGGYEWLSINLTQKIDHDTVTFVDKQTTNYLETQFIFEYKFYYQGIREINYSEDNAKIYALSSDQYLGIIQSEYHCEDDVIFDKDDIIDCVESFYLDELAKDEKDAKYRIMYEKVVHSGSNRVSFALRDNANYQFYFFTIDLDRLNAIEEMLKTFRYKHYFISPIEAPAVDYASTDILQQFEKFKPKLLEYKQNQQNNEI